MAEYIERDEAIRKAQDACIKIVFRILRRGITQFDAADIVDVMESVPTSDVVEVKHGEWKPTEPDSDVRFFCSECETEISTSWDYDNAEMWRYCPNCGAKMDGRSNTNDTK